MSTPQKPSPWFTGFHNGQFLVSGTPTRQIVEYAEAQGWLKFPSVAHSNHALRGGPKPESLFDALPETEATNG